MGCLSPPLTKIPEGDWFCPDCTHCYERKKSLYLGCIICCSEENGHTLLCCDGVGCENEIHIDCCGTLAERAKRASPFEQTQGQPRGIFDCTLFAIDCYIEAKRAVIALVANSHQTTTTQSRDCRKCPRATGFVRWLVLRISNSSSCCSSSSNNSHNRRRRRKQ